MFVYSDKEIWPRDNQLPGDILVVPPSTEDSACCFSYPSEKQNFLWWIKDITHNGAEIVACIGLELYGQVNSSNCDKLIDYKKICSTIAGAIFNGCPEDFAQLINKNNTAQFKYVGVVGFHRHLAALPKMLIEPYLVSICPQYQNKMIVETLFDFIVYNGSSDILASNLDKLMQIVL